MPTLTMDNIPLEIYERLERRATARQRSVQDEAIDLLDRVLKQEEVQPVPRLPDLIPGDEVAAPCDLSRPVPSARVPAHPGKPRLPDPLI